MKLRLLDLFCGAGGAGMGYFRAGFEVVGVDSKPQKHYPFEFHCSDAFAFLEKHGHEFDVIHASPPCQAYDAYRYADMKLVIHPNCEWNKP
jgi:DNA (cytosine-5)-methyltransferase 1